MLSIGISEIIIRKITLVFAYLLTASFVGYFRTWIVLKASNDRLAVDEYEDDLTFNPMAHLDPVGFIVLLFFNIGWLKSLFIDRSMLSGKFAVLRGLVATYADTLIHIFLTIIGIVTLTYFYGSVAQLALNCTILIPNFSYYYHLAQNAAPQNSSLVIALFFIFFAFIQLNMMLAGLTFAFNSVRYAFFPNKDSLLTHNPLMYMLASLVFFFIVVTPVTQLVLHSGIMASKCIL